MNELNNFLIINNNDEEISVLTKMIAHLFPINTIQFTDNSDDALNLLIDGSQHKIIILSDEIKDFNYDNFIEIVKNKPEFKNIFLILLTENDDYDYLDDHLKLGFDDIYLKPIKLGYFTTRINISIRILKQKYSISKENFILNKLSKELEKDFEDMIKLSSKFMHSRLPLAFDILNRVAEASSWISEQFPNIDELDKKEIRIASNLCLIGKSYLPDNLINEKVLVNGRLFNPLMSQVPQISKEIFKDLERFASISHIIYHIYENLDGSGIPGHLSAWNIPLGSRIIRVCLDFEEMLIEGKTQEEIINILESSSKRLYDNRVVYLFQQFLRTNKRIYDFDPNEHPIKLTELKENMIISRDIYTTSSIKIISKGTVINQKIIDIVFSHIANDPILGFIFIKN